MALERCGYAVLTVMVATPITKPSSSASIFERLVEQVGGLGLELDRRALQDGGAVVLGLQRVERAPVEEGQRGARNGFLPLTDTLPVSTEPPGSRRSPRARPRSCRPSAEAAARMVDLALHVAAVIAATVPYRTYRRPSQHVTR